MIDQLRVHRPNITIFMAEIIPSRFNFRFYGQVTALNAQIPALVAAKDTPNSRVILVDLETRYELYDDSGAWFYMQDDFLHPNGDGDAEIATRFFEAMEPFLGNPGVAVTSPVNGSSYNLGDMVNLNATVVDDMGLGNQTGDRWSLDNRYTFADPQMTIGWTVTAYERLTDLPDDQSERAGYATHDVYASWVPRDMQDLTLTAGIYNLFDKEYSDQNTYFLETNSARGIMPGAITSPGRDVRLSVAYRF